MRFLRAAPHGQFERARSLFDRAGAGELELVLSAAVIAETAAILHHTYEIGLREVAASLLLIVNGRGVRVEESEIVIGALERSRDVNVDFIDAYVAAKAAGVGAVVASFDSDLLRKLHAKVVDF